MSVSYGVRRIEVDPGPEDPMLRTSHEALVELWCNRGRTEHIELRGTIRITLQKDKESYEIVEGILTSSDDEGNTTFSIVGGTTTRYNKTRINDNTRVIFKGGSVILDKALPSDSAKKAVATQEVYTAAWAEKDAENKRHGDRMISAKLRKHWGFPSSSKK